MTTAEWAITWTIILCFGLPSILIGVAMLIAIIRDNW